MRKYNGLRNNPLHCKHKIRSETIGLREISQSSQANITCFLCVVLPNILSIQKRWYVWVRLASRDLIVTYSPCLHSRNLGLSSKYLFNYLTEEQELFSCTKLKVYHCPQIKKEREKVMAWYKERKYNLFPLCKSIKMFKRMQRSSGESQKSRSNITLKKLFLHKLGFNSVAKIVHHM